MSKLYPPSIQGTIPACAGGSIHVPYEMNRAVSQTEVSGFSLKIKNIQNANIIQTITWERPVSDPMPPLPSPAVFSPEGDTGLKLTKGCSYKLQMAYIGTDGVTGYYSTVGIMKYIAAPSVSIESIGNGQFIGKYTQAIGSDYTEKVYSYRFTLKDSYGNILEDSGELLHNNENDGEVNESLDSFITTIDLKKDLKYDLTYWVKTINGYEAQTSLGIQAVDSVDSTLKTKVAVKLNYENGYVDVSLTNPDPSIAEEPATGKFILLRASSEDNYQTWSEVLNFILRNQLPSRHLFSDMTVKQGVSYKYALQQTNESQLRSNRIESEVIEVDFEDAFLYDGERQLKIKYNPKVASFKNTLLESKVDTIGGKYPFIFRNGEVLYKEFSISGLLSYLSDEEELFLTSGFDSVDIDRKTINYYKKVDLKTPQEGIDNAYRLYVNINGEFRALVDDLYDGDYEEFLTRWTLGKYSDYYINTTKQSNRLSSLSENIKTTNLTSKNMTAERDFKMEALQWLTNGEPKLFRSPAEGNYLVRLLNVSLSPEDQLGRMLHSFSATAYEVADASYDSLKDYGIINVSMPEVQTMRWETVQLGSYAQGASVLKHSPATSIRLEDAIPGCKLTLNQANGESTSFVIGNTGSLVIDADKGISIESIVLNSKFTQGNLTYSYYTTEFTDSFDFISSLKVEEVASRQFIGAYENIFDELEDVKHSLESVGKIRFYLRDRDTPLYIQAEADAANRWQKYSYDEAGTDMAFIDYVDGSDSKETANCIGYLTLYPLYKKNANGVFEFTNRYIDGYNMDYTKVNNKEYCTIRSHVAVGHEDTSIVLNGDTVIDLWDTTSYDVRDPSLITSIKTGAAVVCEITYRVKEITYGIEENTEISNLKNKYLQAKEATIGDKYWQRLSRYNHKILPAYKAYLAAIEKAIGKE